MPDFPGLFAPFNWILVSIVYSVVGMVIVYVYRDEIPLGYAFGFSWVSSVIILLQLPEVLGSVPIWFTTVGLVSIYVMPFVGFAVLYYLYVDGDSRVTLRDQVGMSRTRSRIRIVSESDVAVLVDHEQDSPIMKVETEELDSERLEYSVPPDVDVADQGDHEPEQN